MLNVSCICNKVKNNVSKVKYNNQVNKIYTEIDQNYCIPLFLSCPPNVTSK